MCAGEDIKDLTVISQGPPPPVLSHEQDPAIISATVSFFLLPLTVAMGVAASLLQQPSVFPAGSLVTGASKWLPTTDGVLRRGACSSIRGEPQQPCSDLAQNVHTSRVHACNRMGFRLSDKVITCTAGTVGPAASTEPGIRSPVRYVDCCSRSLFYLFFFSLVLCLLATITITIPQPQLCSAQIYPLFYSLQDHQRHPNQSQDP